MKILAFLQNQWFKDPERIKAIYDERPHLRNEFIRQFLFMGCLTGRRLSKAFGDEICQQHIIWEEVSPQIGGHASSVFPADHEHIAAALEKHKPTVIVALGKVAIEALSPDRIPFKCQIFYGPHPAARNNPMPRLLDIGEGLRRLAANSEVMF